MMSFLRLFQHLLPRGSIAWSLTKIKDLRRFFEALAYAFNDVRVYADTALYDDFFAATTTIVDEWLTAYGVKVSTSLSVDDKRARLLSVRRQQGGLSPNHIQNTLQQAGFDVYLHPWWSPGYTILCGEPLALCGEPLALCGNVSETVHYSSPNVKNPFNYLRATYLPTGGFSVQCGEPLALCGEPQAQCGNTDEKIGYPLVNKIPITSQDYTALCGEPLALCGEPLALCGEFTQYVEGEQDYTIPNNPTAWRYFTYIGGENFPAIAEVPISRRSEFEALCLKSFPTHLWLGILVRYV